MAHSDNGGGSGQATAAWANELSLMTPRILARINAGRTGRVREIRWVPLGPGTK